MKRVAIALAGAVGTLAVVPIQHADAAENCVTKAEFRKVKNGMSKTRVHKIFDTKGKQSFVVGRYESREYKPCTDPRFGFVLVDYDHGRVDSRSALW